MFQEREHWPAAGAHSIAQLRDSDRSRGGDQVLHDRDSFSVCGPRESDFVAHTYDLASLCKRAHDLGPGSGSLHRFRERRRGEGMLTEKLQKARGRSV